MVTVTSKAAAKFIELRKKKNLPESHHLRLGIKGGGCSGFEYTMDFDDSIDPKDKTWEVDGLNIVVDPKSYLFLSGTTLDFVEDLMESGFKFKNPNATGTCGCGKSVAF